MGFEFHVGIVLSGLPETGKPFDGADNAARFGHPIIQ
jgi:hypothetical protein